MPYYHLPIQFNDEALFQMCTQGFSAIMTGLDHTGNSFLFERDGNYEIFSRMPYYAFVSPDKLELYEPLLRGLGATEIERPNEGRYVLTLGTQKAFQEHGMLEPDWD